MRWQWVGGVTMALGVGLVGCSDAPPPPTEDAPRTAAAVEGALAEASALGKGARTIAEEAAGTFDVAAYEKLLVGLADCEVSAGGIARSCAAWKAFDASRRDRRNLLRNDGAALSAVGRKHLSHESPAVRLQAARLASSLFGGDQASRDALVEAARVEKDPQVLRAMLRSVRSSIGRSDAVRDLLVQMADHPDEQVRMTVLGALSAGWAAGTEGTLEKVLAAVETDPSPRVRAYACRQLGDRADERALPLLERLTADVGEDEKLYEACFRGLIGMWAAPVPQKAPSERAYRLTMERLRAEPRSEGRPPWGAIANLEWAGKGSLAKAAPWFDKDALVEVLGDLAGDRAAHWLARTGAVKVMARIGAPRSALEALEAGYADIAEVPGVDKHVYDVVVEQLARRDGTLPTGDPASVGETIEQAAGSPAVEAVEDAAGEAGDGEAAGKTAEGTGAAAKEAGEALEEVAEGRGKIAVKKATEAVSEAVEDDEDGTGGDGE